jgi:SAM-dependent methyltransferase
MGTLVNENLGADYYDDAWDAWYDMRHYGPMARHTRRLVWKLVGNLKFNSVLDVGCGEGSPLEEIMRRRPGIEVAGVDLSPKAIELAQERIPNGTFSVLDLTKETLDRKFDLIICTDVVEHIVDDRAAIRNMREMCNKWCVISTIQGKMRKYDLGVGHVRNYARGELKAKIEDAGFVVRRQLDWGFPLYSPLYRNIMDYFPTSVRMGKYGPGRRLLAEAMYYAFMLNASKGGDYIFCLAEAK